MRKNLYIGNISNVSSEAVPIFTAVTESRRQQIKSVTAGLLSEVMFACFQTHQLLPLLLVTFDTHCYIVSDAIQVDWYRVCGMYNVHIILLLCC